ncbi:ligand-gated ion channel domain-containing protein [Ditylenchus destructor]|uniref:Ligand-gated ion channel domain-containing protein n=1 Tax=Ditylenchus destructor TaxID=166010 RepID=A0AAD4NHG0_9BILA|nr:ligand-gated ion channel domain-containing protein [Ditylenchus destructor]
MVDSTDVGITDNYIVMVPSFVVFDNILFEVINQLNITSKITVVYDKFFSEIMHLEKFALIIPFIGETVLYYWRRPFEQLPVNVEFVAAVTDEASIRAHFNELALKSNHIFFAAATLIVESYLAAAVGHFEAKAFDTCVVFSKDTYSFRCEECQSVNAFWIRMLPTSRVEMLREFAEFIKKEELDIDMNFKIMTYNEPKISYSIDVMSVAYEYLATYDSSLALLTNRKVIIGDEDPDTKNITAVTLKRLMKRRLEYEFGSYERHYGYTYYQHVPAGIFKIDRRISEPEVNYHKYVGNWTLNDGIIPQYYSLGEDVRRINHYRIVTILQEPFVQWTKNKKTGELVFEGYCIDLLNFVQEDLNFEYSIYLVEDNRIGSADDNGNWDGMIKELVVGTAEIAVGPISVLAERENDIDFTVPFYDLVGTAILMKRTDAEYSLFKFLKVLEWPVWVCIFAAYLFTSVLLWVFDKYSPYSYTNNKDKYVSEAEKREFTLKECLWFCMTSLTPQGGGEAPRNVSGRLVAATWWLFGFIIIASYTANLAAFLTVSRMETSISSLDDLARQYKVEYAPTKGGATETYFRRMAEIEEQFYTIWKTMSLNESMDPRDRAKLAVWDYPVADKFTNMWRFMQESKFPRTVEEGINRVLNSDKGFALIADAMKIKYAILTNCKLQQIGQEFSRRPYAIAVQTGHPLKDSISTSILKLLNERKLETLKEKWWQQNPKRKECPNLEDDSTGIKLQNIGGVFIVILAGIAVSMVILIFEYLYYTQKITLPGLKKAKDTRRASRANGRKNEREIPSIRNGSIYHYTNTAFSHI